MLMLSDAIGTYAVGTSGSSEESSELSSTGVPCCSGVPMAVTVNVVAKVLLKSSPRPWTCSSSILPVWANSAD